MEQDAKIVMVVKEAEARAAYEDALQRVGARYDVAGSFHELLSLSLENSYSGLLIDLLTLVRSSKEEKSIAYDCLNFYPSLRLKWDARNKSMNLSPLEQARPGDAQETLAYFIQSRCKAFTPRSLRRFNRKDTFLSLLLCSGGPDADPRTLKTFTVNVSQGGAFVHTTEPLAKNQPVWLRFVDLPDEGAVQARVRWRIEWGACRSIPGIGVRFDGLSETRADLIKKMANL